MKVNESLTMEVKTTTLNQYEEDKKENKWRVMNRWK